jgi:hypothetical protein
MSSTMSPPDGSNASALGVAWEIERLTEHWQLLRSGQRGKRVVEERVRNSRAAVRATIQITFSRDEISGSSHRRS